MNPDVLSLTFTSDNPDFDPTQDILGTGRLAFLVPDAPFGIDLTRAGYVHDQRWDAATKIDDFHASNHEFRHNVFVLARFQGHNAEICAALSDVYYAGVTNLIARMVFKSELRARGIKI